MRIFVTGATGFLGRAVTAAAVEAGHHVVALARRPPDATVAPWDSPSVEVVRGDLRRPDGWVDAARSADVVVHLAAAKAGEIHEQMAGTVVATERLLDALAGAEPAPRFVLASTFSVYDYEALPVGASLDEASPLEDEPLRRDAYAQTKLLQEGLVRRWAAAQRVPLVVLRPGAVWGAGAWWDAGHAMGFGRIGLAVGGRSEMKLTYIENCADAFVAAATSATAVGGTYNVVDDDQPTQREFERALVAAGVPVRRAVRLPYGLVHAVAATGEAVNRRFLGGRARVPEVLHPLRMSARYRPLHYAAARAHRDLGWSPRYGFAEAVVRAVAADPELG